MNKQIDKYEKNISEAFQRIEKSNDAVAIAMERRYISLMAMAILDLEGK